MSSIERRCLAWTEQTRGQALPWLDTDLEAEVLLGDMLIEHLDRFRLEQLALADPLTGLCNRAMFESKLQEGVTISLSGKVLSAVLMIDLDRFKPVNDGYGHCGGCLAWWRSLTAYGGRSGSGTWWPASAGMSLPSFNSMLKIGGMWMR